MEGSLEASEMPISDVIVFGQHTVYGAKVVPPTVSEYRLGLGA